MVEQFNLKNNFKKISWKFDCAFEFLWKLKKMNKKIKLLLDVRKKKIEENRNQKVNKK